VPTTSTHSPDLSCQCPTPATVHQSSNHTTNHPRRSTRAGAAQATAVGLSSRLMTGAVRMTCRGGMRPFSHEVLVVAAHLHRSPHPLPALCPLEKLRLLPPLALAFHHCILSLTHPPIQVRGELCPNGRWGPSQPSCHCLNSSHLSSTIDYIPCEDVGDLISPPTVHLLLTSLTFYQADLIKRECLFAKQYPGSHLTRFPRSA
jgi:hypothetical protein